MLWSYLISTFATLLRGTPGLKIDLLCAWHTKIMLQLSEEISKLKHEWLADQTKLVSSVSETERLTEEVRAMVFSR